MGIAIVIKKKANEFNPARSAHWPFVQVYAPVAQSQSNAPLRCRLQVRVLPGAPTTTIALPVLVTPTGRNSYGVSRASRISVKIRPHVTAFLEERQACYVRVSCCIQKETFWCDQKETPYFRQGGCLKGRGAFCLFEAIL
jgi:hypothetical protein